MTITAALDRIDQIRDEGFRISVSWSVGGSENWSVATIREPADARQLVLDLASVATEQDQSIRFNVRPSSYGDRSKRKKVA